MDVDSGYLQADSLLIAIYNGHSLRLNGEVSMTDITCLIKILCFVDKEQLCSGNLPTPVSKMSSAEDIVIDTGGKCIFYT